MLRAERARGAQCAGGSGAERARVRAERGAGARAPALAARAALQVPVNSG